VVEILRGIQVIGKVAIAQHSDGQAESLGLANVTAERTAAVLEHETLGRLDGDRQGVGALVAVIGHHRHRSPHGHMVESGRQGQVAVSHDGHVEAEAADLDHGVVDGGIEAAAVGHDHGHAQCMGPAGHVVVIAHDVGHQRARGGDDPLGAPLGQFGPGTGVESVGQTLLGRRKGFDRDDQRSPDGIAVHGRDARSGAYHSGMPIRVGVIGAGTWGTTMAALAAANAPTTLWCRRADLAHGINRDHVNADYLAGHHLPETLEATDDVEQACADADVVVMAVPSHGFRAVLRQAGPHIRPWVPVVSLSKGLEQDTLKRMSEVVHDELPGHPVAVLTGPNLAREILAGQPSASVVGIDDEVIGQELQRIFASMRLRVYTNPDVVGCEVAGVVKNVIAIASGMAEGMGFGDNTRAALITRGLAEMSRLGVALGGQPMTFAGLAGTGDLIATCSSRQSRNNSVGMELGRGRKIDAILSEMKMVAEGVKSSPSVVALAGHHGVEMPICEQVVAVCHCDTTAAAALEALMGRESKSELAGLGDR